MMIMIQKRKTCLPRGHHTLYTSPSHLCEEFDGICCYRGEEKDGQKWDRLGAMAGNVVDYG